MRGTCINHFEPQRFDWVGSGGQGRSKYVTLHGPSIWQNVPYFDLPLLPTQSNFYGSKWLANFGLFQSFPIGHGTEPVYKLAPMMATAPGDDAQGQFERLQWPAPAAAGRTSSSSEPLRERQPVRRPVALHLSNLLLLLLTVELSASWLQWPPKWLDNDQRQLAGEKICQSWVFVF